MPSQGGCKVWPEAVRLPTQKWSTIPHPSTPPVSLGIPRQSSATLSPFQSSPYRCAVSRLHSQNLIQSDQLSRTSHLHLYYLGSPPTLTCRPH